MCMQACMHICPSMLKHARTRARAGRYTRARQPRDLWPCKDAGAHFHACSYKHAHPQIHDTHASMLTNTSMQAHESIHAHESMHAHIPIHAHTGMCFHTRVICISICAHFRLAMQASMRTFACFHAHVHAHSHRRSYEHVHRCIHAGSYEHLITQVRTCSCRRTFEQGCPHRCPCKFM